MQSQDVSSPTRCRFYGGELEMNESAVDIVQPYIQSKRKTQTSYD